MKVFIVMNIDDKAIGGVYTDKDDATKEANAWAHATGDLTVVFERDLIT